MADTRRRFLRRGALAGLGSMAGCSKSSPEDSSSPTDPPPSESAPASGTAQPSPTDQSRADPIAVTLVEADPEAGFNYPYYFQAPPVDPTAERPLLAETANTPGRPTDDFSRHRTAAKRIIADGFPRQIGETLGLPLVVPVVPRPRTEPVDAKTIIQDLDTDTLHLESGPLARIDRQVRRMIEDARRRLLDREYPVGERTFMNGFSSSAFFANRFTALHPEAVDVVAAGGVAGHPILPLAEAKGYTLNYQLGVADLESLIGRPFDAKAWRVVSQYLYMGAEDDSDPMENNDHWEGEQKERARAVYGEDPIEDRFPYAESVYERVEADATFRVFEGVGHRRPPPVREAVIDFFRSHLPEAEAG